MGKRGGFWWVGLLALAMTACGGDGDGATNAAEPLAPGSTLEQVAELPDGQIVVSRYIAYGVTTEGELLASPRADLIANRLVPLLVSETRDGRPAAEAAEPAALLQQQQAFFKQAWDAYAALYPAYSPADIAREVADLDTRIVDLMDDVAASGISLDAYLQLFELVDQLPTFKDLAYTEFMLQQALTQGVKGSTLDDHPTACAAGTERVVSMSGLSWYCQPARAKATDTTRAATASNAPSFQIRIQQLRNDENRLKQMVQQLESELQGYGADIERLASQTAQLQKQMVAAQKEMHDLQVKTYSAQQDLNSCRSGSSPDGECSPERISALDTEVHRLVQALRISETQFIQLLQKRDATEFKRYSLLAISRESQLKIDSINARQTEIQNALRLVVYQQALCQSQSQPWMLPSLIREWDCR